MPSPKRWFPVSHELLTDPQLWTLIKAHGHGVLVTWLWLLSKFDQTDNQFVFPEETLPAVCRALHQTTDRVRAQLEHLMNIGWTSPVHPMNTGWPSPLMAPNYRKYHKVRRQAVPPPILSEPILSEPSEPKRKKRGEGNGARPFPPEFAFTRAMMEYAEGYGIARPADEFQKFKAYHEAKGTRFKNWDAAYRNWILKAIDMQEDRHGKT